MYFTEFAMQIIATLTFKLSFIFKFVDIDLTYDTFK